MRGGYISPFGEINGDQVTVTDPISGDTKTLNITLEDLYNLINGQNIPQVDNFNNLPIGQGNNVVYIARDTIKVGNIIRPSGFYIHTTTPDAWNYLGLNVSDIFDLDNNGNLIVKDASVTQKGITTLQVDTSDVTSSTKAATPLYVSNAIQNSIINPKILNPAFGASITNIILSGTLTYKGIQVPNGVRWLAAGQTDQKQNGVYITGSSNWVRATDADSATELSLAQITATNGDSGLYLCTIPTTAIVGTDSITFIQLYQSDDGFVGIQLYNSVRVYQANELVVNPTNDEYIWRCLIDGTSGISPSMSSANWEIYQGLLYQNSAIVAPNGDDAKSEGFPYATFTGAINDLLANAYIEGRSIINDEVITPKAGMYIAGKNAKITAAILTNDNITLDTITFQSTITNPTPVTINGANNSTIKNSILIAYSNNNSINFTTNWNGIHSFSALKVIGNINIEGVTQTGVVYLRDCYDSLTINVNCVNAIVYINNCPNFAINLNAGAVFYNDMQVDKTTKTANFNPLPNKLYSINTTNNIITATLSNNNAVDNQKILFSDISGTCTTNPFYLVKSGTNNLTMNITSNSITAIVTNGIPVTNMLISGTGISTGTIILSVSGTVGNYTVTLNQVATVTNTGVAISAQTLIGNLATNYGSLLVEFNSNLNNWVVISQNNIDASGNMYLPTFNSNYPVANNQIVPWGYILNKLQQSSITDIYQVYVNVLGDNTTGNGTISSPYQTIAKAESIVNGSGNIIIGTNNYNEALTLTKDNILYNLQAGTNLNNTKVIIKQTTTIPGTVTRRSFRGIQWDTDTTQCINHTSSKGILNLENCAFVTNNAACMTLGANITSNSFNFISNCDFSSTTAPIILPDNSNNSFTANIIAGSPLITNTSINTNTLTVGQWITGTGIPTGSIVAAIASANSFYIQYGATTTSTGATLYKPVSWYCNNNNLLKIQIGLGHIVLGYNNQAINITGQTQNYVAVDNLNVVNVSTKTSLLSLTYASFGGLGCFAHITNDTNLANNGLWQCIAYPFTGVASAWQQISFDNPADGVATLTTGSSIPVNQQFTKFSITSSQSFSLPTASNVRGILFKLLNLSTSTAVATITNITPNITLSPGISATVESDGTNWLKISTTDNGLNNVTNDAQLKRAAGDFNLFTEKTTIVDADIALIEDSASSFTKAKVLFSSIYNYIRSKFVDRTSIIAASGVLASTIDTAIWQGSTAYSVNLPTLSNGKTVAFINSSSIAQILNNNDGSTLTKILPGKTLEYRCVGSNWFKTYDQNLLTINGISTNSTNSALVVSNDFANASNLATVGINITLPYAGTYELNMSVGIYLSHDNTSTAARLALAHIFNSTTSTIVPNSTVNVTCTDMETTTTATWSNSGTASSTFLYATTTDNNILRLRVALSSVTDINSWSLNTATGIAAPYIPTSLLAYKLINL